MAVAGAEQMEKIMDGGLERVLGYQGRMIEVRSGMLLFASPTQVSVTISCQSD